MIGDHPLSKRFDIFSLTHMGRQSAEFYLGHSPLSRFPNELCVVDREMARRISGIERIVGGCGGHGKEAESRDRDRNKMVHIKPYTRRPVEMAARLRKIALGKV